MGIRDGNKVKGNKDKSKVVEYLEDYLKVNQMLM